MVLNVATGCYDVFAIAKLNMMEFSAIFDLLMKIFCTLITTITTLVIDTDANVKLVLVIITSGL